MSILINKFNQCHAGLRDDLITYKFLEDSEEFKARIIAKVQYLGRGIKIESEEALIFYLKYISLFFEIFGSDERLGQVVFVLNALCPPSVKPFIRENLQEIEKNSRETAERAQRLISIYCPTEA